jgi:putative peptidoglycan lipid II flippase
MADIARGVRSFSIGTGISRVLGLVREQVFAYLFGAGMATDAFNAAFRLPNLFRDLFAENALSTAFVPVLTAQKQKSKEAMNRFASNILNTLLLVVGISTLAGIVFSPWLAKIIAPGFGDVPGKSALTAKLAAILFPFLLFIALAAWAMSYLNTEGDYFILSLAPAFFNVVSIAVPIALFAYLRNRGVNPIFGMAAGVTAGGIIQFLGQMPRVRKRGFRYTPFLNFKDPEFRRTMALFLPVAIGLSSSRFNIFVNTILISHLQEKSITWLNYAYRIFFTPLGLFGMAVGTVALPAFVRYIQQGRSDDVRATLFDSLKMVLFLTVPTSAVIAFLAHPLTSVIYEHGKFTAADTKATAAMLTLFMIGVPFASALRNVASLFYAHNDAHRPMYASFASVGTNVALNLILMHVLGYRAFPLSASIGTIVNIGLLYLWLPKKIGPFSSRPLARYAALITLGSVVGGAVAWGGYRGLSLLLGAGLLVKIGNVALAGAAGLLVFYAVCRIAGVAEARDYVRRFLKI